MHTTSPSSPAAPRVTAELPPRSCGDARWFTTTRRWLRQLRQRIPSQCLLCHDWPSRVFCEACWARHVPSVARCVQCALAQTAGFEPGMRCGRCLTQAPPWQQAHAVLSYQAPWTQVLARYKFQEEIGLAWPLAERMAALPALASQFDSVDALVPIPMTRQGLAGRGFNPAERLAHCLSLALWHDAGRNRSLLRRPHAQPPQHELGKTARLRNMRGAFCVDAPMRLDGLHLLLVDDVMTTGATLTAATQTLLGAGAARVDVLVFARTELPSQARRRDNRPLLRPAA